jgi:FKBP-type peptidyl-prolyl cis-trans isomerase
MKYKFLLLIAILFIYASSCNDEPEIEPFNHAAQAIKDNDSIVKYLKTHFLNEDNELEEITNNESAIFNDENLKFESITLKVNDEEIDFKLYYYVLGTEGTGVSPTRIDKVFMAYKGFKLNDEVFDQNNYGLFADLYGQVILGWSYGAKHFKSGEYTDNGDGTFDYSDYGKGFIFIPSGLAYANIGQGSVYANESLVFYLELKRVYFSDHDSDTVFSKDEDINNDDDFLNDDTDSDGLPNYLDDDDDGDGTLTKDEDANGNGNPNDDFSDPDNGDLPDYLNPNIS